MEAAKAVTQAFSKFALIKQLGIFSWNPGHDPNSNLKPFCDVTAQDVLTRLQSEPSGRGSGAGADDLADVLQGMALSAGVPQVQHSSLKLPVNFIPGLPPQAFPNRFPNDPGYIVPLYVLCAFPRYIFVTSCAGTPPCSVACPSATSTLCSAAAPWTSSLIAPSTPTADAVTSFSAQRAS